MGAHETEPAADPRLKPEPKAGEDDERHGDPAYEEGGRRYVRDGAVEIAEDGDTEDEVERSDEDAFSGCGPAPRAAVRDIVRRNRRYGRLVHGRSLVRFGGGLF